MKVDFWSKRRNNMTGQKRCNIALAYLAKTTGGYYGTKASLKQIVLIKQKMIQCGEVFLEKLVELG